MSRSSGHVTHVLLTRSRLCPRPKPGSSLHLHVLSTPPAFVLSQDQTLRVSLAWFQSGRLEGSPAPAGSTVRSRRAVKSLWLPRTPAVCRTRRVLYSGPSPRRTLAPDSGSNLDATFGRSANRGLRGGVWSHVLLSFQRPCARGVGPPPAHEARPHSVAARGWRRQPVRARRGYPALRPRAGGRTSRSPVGRRVLRPVADA